MVVIIVLIILVALSEYILASIFGASSPLAAYLIKLILGSVVSVVIDAFLVPLMIYHIIGLGGRILLSLTGGGFLRLLSLIIVDIIAPIILVFLALNNGIAAIPITNVRLTALIFLSPILLIVAGELIRSLSSKLMESIRSFTNILGIIILMMGLAELFSDVKYISPYIMQSVPLLTSLGLSLLGEVLYVIAIISPYLSVPFTYTAIALLVPLGASLLVFYRPLSSISIDMVRVTKVYALSVFMSSLTYAIGLLTPYGVYFTATSLLIILTVLSLIGYRLYISYAGIGKKISSEVYAQYALSLPTQADYELYNAAVAFMKSGDYGPLVSYINTHLKGCRSSKLRGVINKLVSYTPPYYGGLWPWEVSKVRNRAVADAEARKGIVLSIMDAASSCRRVRQVQATQATIPATEDGTRVYSEEELSVRPLEESEQTVVKPEDKKGEGSGS